MYERTLNLKLRPLQSHKTEFRSLNFLLFFITYLEDSSKKCNNTKTLKVIMVHKI